MNLDLLLKGLLIGFSISAPIGPISILCINSTLNKGRNFGLIIGLGSACVDILFALIAGFGLTIVVDLLINYSGLIKIIGGIFLCYLGIRIFNSKPAYKSQSLKNKDFFSTFLSAFFLTIINPVSIMLFIALFTPLIISDIDRNYLSVFTLVMGVFTGAMLWWIILSNLINLLRGRIDNEKLSIINKISGAIIFIFGGYEFIKIFVKLIG